MSRIKKGHPRFGAKVGDVVDGWKCTSVVYRCADFHGERWSADSTADEATVCPRCERLGTKWRRVRPVLVWERDEIVDSAGRGKFALGYADDEMRLLVPCPGDGVLASWGIDADEAKAIPYPPHVTTRNQRRRFAERIARLYGYEVKQ